jgi:hypothetical protein
MALSDKRRDMLDNRFARDGMLRFKAIWWCDKLPDHAAKRLELTRPEAQAHLAPGIAGNTGRLA